MPVIGAADHLYNNASGQCTEPPGLLAALWRCRDPVSHHPSKSQQTTHHEHHYSIGQHTSQSSRLDFYRRIISVLYYSVPIRECRGQTHFNNPSFLHRSSIFLSVPRLTGRSCPPLSIAR